MAYGQTGTGKTYTMGRLGKDDPSERGIMVRALEDILASVSPLTDSVAISYLQVCRNLKVFLIYVCLFSAVICARVVVKSTEVVRAYHY